MRKQKKANARKNHLLNPILIIVLFVIFVALILPSLITIAYGNFNNTIQEVSIKKEPPPKAPVIINNSAEETSHMDKFEDYILHVVAAEMPISFELEALKSQAIAARTYAIKQIQNYNMDEFRAEEIGQAYLSTEELIERFDENYNEYYAKLKKAIETTKGEILKYNEEPIEAVFHSTSSGKTENSENVWQEALPYLVSVDSADDLLAPNFSVTKEFDASKAREILIQYFHGIGTLQDFPSSFEIKILERSKSGYVTKVSVFGNELSGRELRTIFDLRSSHFTLQQTASKLIFETKGYGHGVGMSQYGANFMAQSGSTYQDILFHYYKDVELFKLY